MNLEQPNITPEKQIENGPLLIEVLVEELEKDAVLAEKVETSIAEQPRKITETELRTQSVFGRARDVFSKLTLTLPLFALLASGVAGGASYYQQRKAGTEGTPETFSQTNLEKEKIKFKYGSPEYKEALEKLRGIWREVVAKNSYLKEKIKDQEILNWIKFIGIVQANEDNLFRTVDAALFELEATEWEAERKKILGGRGDKANKKMKLEETRWSKLLQQINYPQILDKEALEFGVQPYRRLGYNQYKEFNEDVLKITEVMNARIEELNRRKNKSYPLLSPGIVSATSLQEGLATQIDIFGYLPDKTISSFTDIGLDALVVDLPRLQSLGLLAKTFGEKSFKKRKTVREEITGKAYTHRNETGLELKRLWLKTREAIEGVAAILVERRNKIIDEIGVDKWESFSEDEQDWLSYAAYQWGQGNVISLLRDNSINIREPAKKVPISNFVKYVDGKPAGQVESVKDFIKKNHGRKHLKTLWGKYALRDFHVQASQVAISSRIANKFFNIYRRNITS